MKALLKSDLNRIFKLFLIFSLQAFNTLRTIQKLTTSFHAWPYLTCLSCTHSCWDWTGRKIKLIIWKLWLIRLKIHFTRSDVVRMPPLTNPNMAYNYINQALYSVNQTSPVTKESFEQFNMNHSYNAICGMVSHKLILEIHRLTLVAFFLLDIRVIWWNTKKRHSADKLLLASKPMFSAVYNSGSDNDSPSNNQWNYFHDSECSSKLLVIFVSLKCHSLEIQTNLTYQKVSVYKLETK